MQKEDDNAFKLNYTPENDNDSASWGGFRFNDQEYKNKSFGSFGPYYAKHIRSFCKSFNLERIEAKRSATLLFIICYPSIAIIIYFTPFSFVSPFTDGAGILIETRNSFLGGIYIGVVGGLFAWPFYKINLYKKKVGGKIYPLIFRFFGSDYRYKDEEYLDLYSKVPGLRSLSDHKIIPYYNKKSSNTKFEGYVKGTYKGVTLEHVQNVKLRRDNSSWTDTLTYLRSAFFMFFNLHMTAYKGILITLTMNKNFSGETIVKKDNGLLGRWFSRKYIKTIEGLENIKLEDPVFEKKFEVYSNDQIEARYLLSTSFMARLLQLAELFPSKKILSTRVIIYSSLIFFTLWIMNPITIEFSFIIFFWYICVRLLSSERQGGINGGVQCSFRDNKLLLMIPCYRKPFATSIFKPATFVDDINHILKEMAIIFEIIDILKLERKTGL
jgi:hypothetical protein